jgi:hypothetical protein
MSLFLHAKLLQILGEAGLLADMAMGVSNMSLQKKTKRRDLETVAMLATELAKLAKVLTSPPMGSQRYRRKCMARAWRCQSLFGAFYWRHFVKHGSDRRRRWGASIHLRECESR